MARLQEDVRRLRFWRSLIAEFLGTMFLVLLGCGAWTELDSHDHLFTVKVALTFGLTYMAVLYCVRGLGEAHMNPAITLAMLATRRTSVIRAALFIACQFVGGILGAAFVRAITSGHDRNANGCTKPADHVNEGQGFGVEFFATFFFVFVVFACYDKSKGEDPKSRDVGGVLVSPPPPRWSPEETTVAPFVIGLTYSAVLLFAIPYTGGSANTARSFGPAVVNNVWTAHWIFWFGPLLGGIAGGGIYDLIFSTRASFRRLHACLFVFHRREDATTPGSPSRQDVEKHSLEYNDDVTEARRDNIVGSQDYIVDGDDVMSSSPAPAERATLEDKQKPRLKLFRPKFSCCQKQEAPEPIYPPNDNQYPQQPATTGDGNVPVQGETSLY